MRAIGVAGPLQPLSANSDDMLRLFQRSRAVADTIRCARDISLGLYSAAVARMLAPGSSQSVALERVPVQKILVLKLDRLGDVVLASPLFRELRRNYPDATITAVTSAESFPLMRSCPYVDRTIVGPASLVNISGAKRFACSLRDESGVPDLTLIPRHGVDLYGATWVSFFSGAPIRVAFAESVTARKSRVNRGADGLFTHVIQAQGIRHEVERNLEMLEYLGLNVSSERLEFWPTEAEIEEANALLAAASAQNSDLIAVGIGASHAKRLWPVERYAEVCSRLHQLTNARFVVMGSRSDRPLLDRFRELTGDIVAVSGSVSLGTVGAIFSRCRLFLGCDSAQKHIAAAVGVPVTEISCHSTEGDPGNPSFHAWGVPYTVLQPDEARNPCRGTCEALEAHCILDVSVDDVEQASMALIGASGAQRVSL